MTKLRLGPIEDDKPVKLTFELRAATHRMLADYARAHAKEFGLAEPLPIERLIEPDRADGVLDQLFLHGVADETTAMAKIAAHWLTFGPLLIVAAFPAAALLDIGGEALAGLLLAILIGTPALAALAVAVAALTSGLPRAGSMAGLLLLPLAVPLLIFGAANALLLEAAVSLSLTAGAPFVAAAAIRASRT